MCEVPPGDEFLNELLAEFPLHERIRRYHSYKASRAGLGSIRMDSKVKESLFERHGKRILHVARLEASSVRLIERRILHSDIGRIANNDVVLPSQELSELFDILDVIVMPKGIILQGCLLYTSRCV